MPSTYSPNLRVELIGTGEQSGTWGSTTNNNLGTILESAISGYLLLNVAASQYLSALNGVDDQSRNMVIEFSNLSTVLADFTIYIPPAEKYYVIKNNTAYKATIAATSNANTTGPLTGGTTVDVPAGKTMLLFCDAYNVAEALTYVTNLTAGSLTLTTRLPETSGGVPAQTVGGVSYGSCFLTTDGTNAFWSGTGIKTVRVATTAALTYPFSGLQAPSGIDGVTTLAAGDRVLVKNQGAGNESQHGIWVVNAGTWSRSADANTVGELAGSIVNVQQGTTNGGTQWATSFTYTGNDPTVTTITANTWSAVVPLPVQSGSASKVLTTNGTTASWVSPTAKTVSVATTTNLTSLAGSPVTIDGVTVSSGARVLVKNQTLNESPVGAGNGPDNGIYVVASGTWARADDAINVNDLAGAIVSVQAGNTNGGKQFATTLTSNAGSAVGTSTMAWSALVTSATAGGVTTFSGGTTGLTPSTATPGAITLAGTLNVANGGTGVTTLTGIVKGNGTGAFSAAASGTDFKTINNTSILGSGNITTGTVTQVSSGSGMNFTGFTGSGTVTMGTPSSITTSSSNGLTATSHTHALDTTGLVLLTAFTGAQTLSGNGYQTFPGDLMIQWGSVVTAGGATAINFGQTFSAVYAINVTPKVPSGHTGGVSGAPAVAGSLTTTGCTVSHGTGSITNLYWVAIGKA